MTCHNCRIEMVKAGKRPDGEQRYRCSQSGKTFSEGKQFGVLGQKQLDNDRGPLALKLFVKRSSIRSTERIRGMHRDTVTKLFLIAGERCQALLAAKVRNVPITDVFFFTNQIDVAQESACRLRICWRRFQTNWAGLGSPRRFVQRDPSPRVRFDAHSVGRDFEKDFKKEVLILIVGRNGLYNGACAEDVQPFSSWTDASIRSST